MSLFARHTATGGIRLGHESSSPGARSHDSRSPQVPAAGTPSPMSGRDKERAATGIFEVGQRGVILASYNDAPMAAVAAFFLPRRRKRRGAATMRRQNGIIMTPGGGWWPFFLTSATKTARNDDDARCSAFGPFDGDGSRPDSRRHTSERDNTSLEWLASLTEEGRHHHAARRSHDQNASAAARDSRR